MCGIAGVVSDQSIDCEHILQLLYHRGPDHQTIYSQPPVTLMHTRLAIQDVQHGVQPFHFQQYSIIFNGEIYNHIALRSLLCEFVFQTNSDTETLLYLFIKYQYKVFDFLDGMYAFCIFDQIENKLILARDRAGKKPLYYSKEGAEFFFASELNVIKAIKNVRINTDAIQCYLRAGYISQPHTPYVNVNKLNAGSYLILDINTFRHKTNLHFNMLDAYQQNTKLTLTLKEATNQLETHLKRSVADRMMASDVEVGVFLSGGIDSNLIVAMASQVNPDLKTFTVKFDGAYDESALAKLTAQKYKTHHVELTVSADLKNDIEKILLNYGEPFMDSSAIPSYYVSREAARHVKVILGGDGADELFAGYRRYVPLASAMTKYLKLFSPLIKYFPNPQNKKSLYNYFHRMMTMMGKQKMDFYFSATTDIYEDVYAINNNTMISELDSAVSAILESKSMSRLNQLLYLDFSNLLFSDLLVKMDIASMANSLEVRSPFLSKYLLEFAPVLPDKFKINRGTTKFILRNLAKQYLPKPLINQPKRGFEVPLKKWVNHDLKENIFDRLQPGCYSEKFIDRAFIQNVKEEKISIPAEKRAKILWSLYCLEVWHDSL